MEIANKIPPDFFSENARTDELRMRLARQHAKQQLKNIFLQVPVAISILRGPDYIIEVVNDKMLEFWVNQAEAVLNKPLFEAMPDLKMHGLDKLLAALYHEGKRFAGVEVPINILRNNTLERVFVTFVYEPLYKEDGSIYALIVVAHEITEQVIARQSTEESRHLYHNVIYSSPSLIAVLKGEEMILTIANDAILKQLGKGKDIVGKPYFKSVPELEEQLGDILKNVYKTGEPFFSKELPMHLVRNDKSELSYYDLVYQPQRNKNGDIEGVAIIANEVTAQAEFNIKIRESEERFRTLSDQIPMIVNISEPKLAAMISYFNKSWLDYTGQQFEEALTRGWDGIVHPDDIEKFKDVYGVAFKNKQAYTMPAIRLKRYDGEYRWHMLKGNPRFLADGQFMGFIGVGFDVHERKLAEEMLGYRKALLEAHNEASIDGIMLVDAKGKILSYNQRFIEIWNMPQEIADANDDDAALAFAMTQLINPEQFIEKVKWLYAHPTQISMDELEFVSGKIVERHGYPVKGEDGTLYAWSWTFRDVTEQRIYEKNIKASEAGFRLMADLMPEKVINADEEGRVIYYNENWVEYTGLSIAELKNTGWVKLIHPDDLEDTGKKWRQSIESGNDFETETRLLDKNGEYRWHLSRAKAVKSDEGKIKFWIGVNTDIQHQKKQREGLEEAVASRTYELLQANEELQQKNQEIAVSKYNKRFLSEFSEKFSAYQLHNEFFNSLVQFIADTTRLDYVFVGKLVQDDKGEQSIQTISITAFGKLTGNIKYPLKDAPCEQVIRNIRYSFPKNCRQLFEKNITMQQFNVEGYLGYPLNDDKGNAVGLIAVMHGHKIEDTDTVSSVLKIVARRTEIELEIIKNEEELVFQNIEKEKRAVELDVANKELIFQNEEKEKQAAELIVANNELKAFTFISSHDLQEPLRKIQTFATRILEDEYEGLSENGKDYFKRMHSSARRMQTLIEDLLAYSHTNITERKFEKIDLDIIVKDVMSELSESLAEKNAVIKSDHLGEAYINPFQFRQVVINLVTNALKFSKEGVPPYIIIKTRVAIGRQLEKEDALLSAGILYSEKEYTHISFTDNGIGFDPEYKHRIFEVFQRLHNKEAYKGTGIGLAIVKKIIDNHNGVITASGKLKEGATFNIYIPVVQSMLP